MQLVRLAILLSVCSLWSCKNDLDVYTCLVDAANNGLDCVNAKTNHEMFVPLPDADNYICMSPDDFETMINYVKLKCRKKPDGI